MSNMSSSSEMTSLSEDVRCQLRSLPIKIKYMNTKPISKKTKTLVIDLDQCDQNGHVSSKSISLKKKKKTHSKNAQTQKSISQLLSKLTNFSNSVQTKLNVVQPAKNDSEPTDREFVSSLEGNVKIQSQEIKANIESNRKNCTEHPAVLMHPGYFEERSRQLRHTAPSCSSNESEGSKRNGRRKWRRDVMEPPKSPPLPIRHPKIITRDEPVPVPVCVRATGLSPQHCNRRPSSSPKTPKSGKKSTKGPHAESMIVVNSPERQSALRRSKSGHVPRSRTEVEHSSTKSGYVRKKMESEKETLFGFPVRCASKSAETRTGSRSRPSGNRRQWGKPSVRPEFQGQDESDTNESRQKLSGSSSVSVETSTTEEGSCHLKQHPSLMNVLSGYVAKNFADSEERKCREDGEEGKGMIWINLQDFGQSDAFRTHRVYHTRRSHKRSRDRISVESSTNEHVEIESSQSRTFIVPTYQSRKRLEDDSNDGAILDDLLKMEEEKSRQVIIRENRFSPTKPSTKMQFPFNSIISMGEMFKSECLHECGSWKTRNKKFAWPQEVLEEALSTLTNSASKAKSAAMQTIGRLAAFYPEVAEGEQLALVRGLTREIKDPRPYVARLALVCLMLLFSRLRFNMVQCLLETCSVLLTVLATAKCSYLKRDIVSALDHLPDLVVPQQAIQVLLGLVEKHSQQIVRQTVSKCVASIIERRGSGVVLEAPSTLTEMVLSSAIQFFTDSDPIVRSSGVKVVRLLESHPSFEVVLRNHVSMQTFKAVSPLLKEEIRKE